MWLPLCVCVCACVCVCVCVCVFMCMHVRVVERVKSESKQSLLKREIDGEREIV